VQLSSTDDVVGDGEESELTETSSECAGSCVSKRVWLGTYTQLEQMAELQAEW